MTLEEAGEIVLQGKPWTECPICETRGHVDRAKCSHCSGAGFLLSLETVVAYEICEVPVPTKPLTFGEKMAKVGSNFIRARLNEVSATRRLFPPKVIP